MESGIRTFNVINSSIKALLNVNRGWWSYNAIITTVSQITGATKSLVAESDVKSGGAKSDVKFSKTLA